VSIGDCVINVGDVLVAFPTASHELCVIDDLE